MAAPAPRRPAFISSVIYRDQRAALEWLQRAFGFDVSGLFIDSEGNIVHAEMSHADGVVMISNAFTDWTKSPASIGGTNTQRIHVRLESGIDEHFERAREAGAKVVMEPADQFYGDRTYSVEDFEGHRWTFAQPVRDVSFEDMEKATGFKFKSRL
jgi:uncharacterized glyoxalase superfamily protein PhnB